MSTFKKDTIQHNLSVPAFDYYRREPKSDNSINITDDELVSVGGKHFHAFGLFGSCLKDNRDPVESYERTIRNGHSIAALSGAGICVAGNQGKTKVIVLDWDDIIYIEGHAYRMSPAPNVNVYLTEIPTSLMVDHKYI